MSKRRENAHFLGMHTTQSELLLVCQHVARRRLDKEVLGTTTLTQCTVEAHRAQLRMVSGDIRVM